MSELIDVTEAIGAAGTAIGTITVAALAIWGDGIRAWLDPPRLLLGRGSLSQLVTLDGGRKQRYYLIPVTNSRRRRPAHEVRVFLTRLENRVNERPHPIFTERIPLRWDRQEALPPALTVGTDAFVSLFCIQNDGSLIFTPYHSLAHFPEEHREGTYWAELRATSAEKDSGPYRFKIDWTGQWADGESEIQDHCRVEVDPQTRGD